jgi:hypothetical protein
MGLGKVCRTRGRGDERGELAELSTYVELRGTLDLVEHRGRPAGEVPEHWKYIRWMDSVRWEISTKPHADRAYISSAALGGASQRIPNQAKGYSREYCCRSALACRVTSSGSACWSSLVGCRSSELRDVQSLAERLLSGDTPAFRAVSGTGRSVR